MEENEQTVKRDDVFNLGSSFNAPGFWVEDVHDHLGGVCPNCGYCSNYGRVKQSYRFIIWDS